jgi:hypothetical protein
MIRASRRENKHDNDRSGVGAELADATTVRRRHNTLYKFAVVGLPNPASSRSGFHAPKSPRLAEDIGKMPLSTSHGVGPPKLAMLRWVR